MPVKSQILKSRELSMSQLPLLWLLDLIRLMARSLLSTTWEVELSIFPFLRFLEESLKSKPPTVILHLVVRTLISASSNSWLLNLRANTAWILVEISWLFRESEKLPRKLKLSSHPPIRQKSILPTCLLMQRDQSIYNYQLQELNWKALPIA